MQDALIRVSFDGDLESLYREHGTRLWRAVVAFSGDPEVASDAVAEAFAQALRREEEIREPLAWIWRASFRVASGELKARRKRPAAPPPGRTDVHDDILDVIAALAKLSKRQRAAVILHHYAGYPVKEVAVIIGSTPAAVRVHLSRGRKRLRGLLEVTDG